MVKLVEKEIVVNDGMRRVKQQESVDRQYARCRLHAFPIIKMLAVTWASVTKGRFAPKQKENKEKDKCLSFVFSTDCRVCQYCDCRYAPR